MTRLERLRGIRAIELQRGLRALAEAESRIGQLAAMRHRVALLAGDVPAAEAVTERKAGTACSGRLELAAGQLDTAHAAAREVRAATAEAAARLRVRVDVVDTALAARR